MVDVEQHLIVLSHTLLEAIAEKDWETYSSYCDPSLSCFEPEAAGQLVEGLKFHKFYFELKEDKESTTKVNITMTSPMVRIIGEKTAIITYNRLTQRHVIGSPPTTTCFEETRIWEKDNSDNWKLVHFHKSLSSPTNSINLN
eukprot:TRINITY_DN225_c0_g1_i1.p2 TRINITY_DN225_c0_g1~~TRINITY_DN225_c0_g1_i1.p2  ORF type:complete len:142 (-),score=15.21 TRINITY_DN225_c0_g1_i1:2623-3048(-)